VLPKNWFLSNKLKLTAPTKYILCRPCGGLNDVLTQIEKCWRYAEKFNRTLIIDTRNSESFKSNFDAFFKVNENYSAIINVNEKTISALDRMDAIPVIIKNQLDNYIGEWDPELNVVVKLGTREVLSFNFNEDYKQPLLVHHDFGGRDNRKMISQDCLRRLKVTPNFGKSLLSRLQSIQDLSYMAIHIRHTDYQTDYQKFFSEIHSECIGENLLICTDNHRLFIEAQKFFKESNVFNLGKMTDTKETPRHLFDTSQAEKYTITVESMADLIALSQAKKLFITKLIEGGLEGYSGFSLLAKKLSENPSVINKLLKFDH